MAKRILKILGGIAALLLLVVVVLVGYVQVSWDKSYTRAEATRLTAGVDAETITRGEYLYWYGSQCWGCHSPPGTTADPRVLPVGGQKFDLSDIGPGFGIYYATNLTPDPETGIGNWTDGELVRALREGVDREGRTLFPIMPAEYYKGLSDQDALAIVAYLRTLPPTRNETPANQPSFVAKALFALKILKPQPAITQPIVAPPAGPTAEYGQYLAINASGCSECHTPRNLQNGEVIWTQLFAGANFAIGEAEGATGSAHGPNLTPDPETGIGNWTEEQFITAMRTGMKPGGTVMLTLMPYPYYSFWTDDDLKAVYLYLKTVPNQTNRVSPPTFSAEITGGEGFVRGEALYGAFCESCHGDKGKGGTPTAVALSQIAPEMDDAALRSIIDNGMPGTRMPGFGKTITQEQVSDVIEFIRSFPR
jgi:mono/diheme cytochrome c family protein